ncbi:uncharacterized protein B0I36DRAFT_315428 [Microdochium trichocladiopsis]|uniref:Tyrosine specific protein phosphatases domain-containing protein n=1 Tax=Microdochium trichocladiopsis TaxID=1682393 RepID=A0A9P9BV30_9PEZI|nr:uncharacterized protein B0I36DRAFT_315428 [Microdochium trichocladiopsis]KAH7038069.1 hypothetical protein B0I36DRAFT_315428 [Microdochium trichocladiopsis]
MASPPAMPEVADGDPPLLRDHSRLRAYTAAGSGVTYRGLRIFYRPHPKAAELPVDPAPLPLLVFLHGLGGSVAQFHPLLTSLANSASTLAIDLPGCGRSLFEPKSWDAYSTDALVDLVETVINDHRADNQGVVFIAHSMGTVLAARLSNRSTESATENTLANHVMGLVAICPVAGPLSEAKANAARKLLWIPEFVFNIWRAWDRWGGPESASVRRFVGPGADKETRVLQDCFNSQSRSGVFRRMAWGSLPTYVDGQPIGGLFGKPSWAGLDIPIYLIAGEHDTVTPPSEVVKIMGILDADRSSAGPHVENGTGKPVAAVDDSEDVSMEPGPHGASLGDAAAPVILTGDEYQQRPACIEAISTQDFERRRRSASLGGSPDDPSTPRDPDGATQIPPQPRHPVKVIKTITLPSGHALLYAPTVVRVLAGLIGDFLNEHITGRFSLGWQLQHLSREGKWDVKNLTKWKGVRPVSEPVAGIFRAMKTLREVDEEHCPKVFTEKWGSMITDVIDISHDNPVYDPRSFGEQIRYHKFPTVSKVPPTDQEVEQFITLVDRLREEQKARPQYTLNKDNNCYIGVHCHYGFNRTGYFVVCYLIERCNYGVQEAIETFAAARPNGIRHVHFLDRLFVRYSGLVK